MNVPSNKSLAVLLMFSIIVSLFGTLITLTKISPNPTGYGVTDTSSGTVNYSVASNVDINFTNSIIDFGVGYVGTGYSNCTLVTNSTNQSIDCAGFHNVTTGFLIENIGNKLAEINLSFTDGATTFIHGSGSRFMFAVNNESEPGSCVTEIPNTYDLYNFTDITAYANYTICSKFNFTPSEDLLEIDVKLIISEAASGDHETTIRASASEVSA